MQNDSKSSHIKLKYDANKVHTFTNMVLHGLNMLTFHKKNIHVQGYHFIKFQSCLDEKMKRYSIKSQNIALVWHKHGPIMVQRIKHYIFVCQSVS